MKELPVKIWAHIGPHLGLIQANGCFAVGAPGEKEYIQKDALLDWLQPISDRLEKEWKADPFNKQESFLKQQVILSVIDEINSL